VYKKGTHKVNQAFGTWIPDIFSLSLFGFSTIGSFMGFW